MKYNNLKFAIAGFAAIVIITIVSCKKKLDLTDPNRQTVETYFKTSAQIQEGVNSVYTVLRGVNMMSREWFFVHDTRSDEVSTGGSQLEAPRFQMLSGNTDPTNPLNGGVYGALYVMIHRANTVIASAAYGTDNATLTARLVAEAKFFRGWAYYELVSMWGAVPLVLAPVSAANDYQSRSKVADIYAAILSDLQAAATVLPGKSGYDANNRGRVTNAVANAMLGRVNMQQGDYAAAKAALLKIQSSGADGYQLNDRYLDNFEEETELNKESIFEVIFFDKGNGGFNWGSGTGDGANADLTTVRNQEYNAVAWRNLVPSDKFLANFEHIANGATKIDPRLSYSVYQSGDLINKGTEVLTDAMQNGSSSILNGVTKKISWRKFMLTYKENSGFHPGGNNQRLIRYAEVLINLAECEAELGNLPAAAGYLNKVRDRASVAMPHYPTTKYFVDTKENTIKTIMHEKMAEMGCEEIRNVDILRWRKKGYFTTDPLSYFKVNRDELLPIPQQEIDNNPRLGDGGISKQNPGY